MLWRTVIITTIIIIITTTSLTTTAGARNLDGNRPSSSARRARRSAYNDTKCPYPCTCPTIGTCSDCEECPRQLREPCDESTPCDITKGLKCAYLHEGDSEGICKESLAASSCVVRNKTYQHGEIFSPDCRTQCSCQNGTYGCASLCPQEHISLEGACEHPRLVDVPGQCCRQWMCTNDFYKLQSTCEPSFTKWSECSSFCGMGYSTRKSNLNGLCEMDAETRVCQIRRCETYSPVVEKGRRHYLKKDHECKATHRLTTPVYLHFGPCTSKKRYRPKFCGTCTQHSKSCKPLLSTTVKMDFVCESPDEFETDSNLLLEYLEPGEDLWIDSRYTKTYKHKKELTVSVQWVLKCSCELVEEEVEGSTTVGVLLHRVHRTAAP